ncbi:MAG: CDP-glycerol glycerophosphotransferase family protein, partial [Propionibacteriaceae bacterium]
DVAGEVVVVDSVQVDGPAGAPALRLSGASTLAPGTPLRLELRTASGGSSVVVAVEKNGRVAASIPLTADRWGFGGRVLPSATYDLVAAVDGRAETAGRFEDGIQVRVGDALLADLPRPDHRPGLRTEVQLRRPAGLQLEVRPPLDDTETGARPQRALQDGLARRLAHPEVEPASVLLRSYYGEICGCNPLAVHQELRRLGTDHTIYWAVRDHSVVVPEGGIPVIYESAEWYRVLHQAEYYVDNMHQPLYHRKPPHQVQVQTFHGYPFKQMGVSHWSQQQRDVAHVRSYLARAADWDYLVSPASYGTAALCAEFGFPNEVLEIGYPRNDVLQDARAAPLRVEVRRRLGIADHQTAVLYGPTFRDQLSRNDFVASMIDFLDVAELSRLVGPDVVVLIRGHAFNARTAERVATSGNVVDVTDYPDIAGLCLASDAAVLDYSSLRFDYALTGKPMIFMVPDLEIYLGRTRGSMFAFEPTAPGPFVSTTAEVAAAVADLDGVRARFAEPYATFRRDYLDLDDGLAARRLVERVFLR